MQVSISRLLILGNLPSRTVVRLIANDTFQ
jgi:hypothetical protein